MQEINEELGSFEDFDSIIQRAPQNIKKTLEILDEKEQNDLNLQAHIELVNEYKTPKEKRAFVEQSLESAIENENVEECLYLLEEQEKVQEQIDKLNEEIASSKADEAKNEAEKNASMKNDKMDEALDEKIEQAKIEMEKRHEDELERLKDKQKDLQDKFNKSIENLLNSNDIAGILKSLNELDKSLSLMIKEGKANFETLDKQRREKLQIALESQTTKEVIKDFITELHDKTKQAQGELNEMKKESDNYYRLDEQMELCKKSSSIKNIEKLQTLVKRIDEETPNFKQTYPKIYDQSQEIIKKSQEKVMESIKGREI